MSECILATSGHWDSQFEPYTSPGSIWNDFVNIFNTYKNEFENDDGLQGYLISHEDLRKGTSPPYDYSHQPRITDMLNYITNQGVDPAHERVILEFRLDDEIIRTWLNNNKHLLDVFECDKYVFKPWWPYYAGADYQYYRIDNVLEFYDYCKDIFSSTNTDWHAIIQACQELNANPEVKAGLTEQLLKTVRWPTESEINVQSYLALTRGARGIKCFMYGSADYGTDDLEGLLENTFTGGERNKRLVSYPWGVDLNPFDFVAGLFSKLKILGPVFSELEVDQAYTATNENNTLPPDAYVTVTSGNYIEAGVFHNRVISQLNEKYILLVNRVCNNTDGSPASNQTITVELNDSPTTKRIIEDLYITHSTGTIDVTAVLQPNEFTFQIDLEPGEGRLFRVNYPPDKPTGFDIAGNIGDNPTLSWDANIEQDLDGYNIYVKYGGGSEQLLTTVDANTTTFADPGVVITGGKFHPLICYRISALDLTNNESDKTNYRCVLSDQLSKPIISSEENNKIPGHYKLYEAYPNPFNPNTTISFDLPEDNFVSLLVYNIQGEKIATLVNEHLPAGSYTAKFDGSQLSSGVYIYKIQAGSFSQINRMLLIK